MPSYTFNKNFFDKIDNEIKAYWIGFLWSDGYLGIRNRPNRRLEYNLKLSLSTRDSEHLQKFNEALEGNYPVHIYHGGKGSYTPSYEEARIFITNQYFGQILEQQYGIFANRNDIQKITSQVPEELYKHFLRGILDADGSFTKYQIQNKGYNTNKYHLTFGGCPQLVDFIEQVLIKQELVADIVRKKSKRHKEVDRDLNYRELRLSGKTQALKVLNWLYEDSTVYLDRKYEKYLNLID